ncbi:hypothetical protein FFWV33_00435 [Flavobacterium faecale]|uniref:Copper-binding protein MbnP-like domain-containing protein n=1 Tax=Flavobacterium faecale TaxID=1355330 RepID=A0A2S1L8L4_9FLAO|nr:MbnP family protein [Flavobacterium faecale]AWG20092.1 hypothetical protein FFWV33_00435 [Flavobacterium faecale]
MKNTIYRCLAVLAVSLFTVSCSNSDEEAITGTGSLNIEYDNAFGSNDLILQTQANTTSNGEVLKINKIKYIISNIVLTKDDGTVLTYPKSESYFIIDEGTIGAQVAELKNIPAGNYTKVKFGIGVDKAQFDLGATGQGDFLTTANTAGMLWNWTSGYKFLAYEGTFTSPTQTTAAPFTIHTGQTGTDYNYTEVTLDLPTNAQVRTTITPDVHLIVDLSKITDGTNKINLSEQATIMGGAKLPLIVKNVEQMFRVDHVHND